MTLFFRKFNSLFIGGDIIMLIKLIKDAINNKRTIKEGDIVTIETSELHLKESVKRAREAGVPEDKILHNYEEGEKFFMS